MNAPGAHSVYTETVQRSLVIGGGLLLVGASAALVWALSHEEPAPESARNEPARAGGFPDVDPYEFFAGEGDEDDEPVAVRRSEDPSRMGFTRADWENLTQEERRAKRREMRREWLEMTPEERAERRAARAARRVSVTATGDGEPALEPIDVMHSVRDVRPQIRECVQNNGGWQQFREAMAASANPDAGPGGGRGMTLAFDVEADGQVGALQMNPPPPENFADCFTGAFDGLDMPPPGAGAHVEMRLGGGGRRARVTGNGRQGG